MRQQRLRRAGAVETEKDRVTVAVLVRDLGQCCVDGGDVIGGGIASSVAWPQHPGQGFVGVVAEGQHRMETPAVFERRCGLFLLRVGDRDRGVLVDHQHRTPVPSQQRRPGHHRGRQHRAGRFATLGPSHLAGRRPGLRDRGQTHVSDRVQNTPACRVRGHRPEHTRLITERGDIADALPAISDHHRQIAQHPTRVVRRLRRGPTGEHRRQLRGQRGPVRQISQQPRPRVRHDTITVSRHHNRRASTSSVHLESAFPFGINEPSASSESPTGKALSHIYTPTTPVDLEEPGLMGLIGWISVGLVVGVICGAASIYFLRNRW